MSLHPTQRAREKILLAGPWGSGKSYARNRLIHTLNASGSTATVRILDTDDTKDRAWDAYGDAFMERVEWEYVNSYEDWKDGAEKFAKDTGPDDWIVPDRIDLLWEASQQYFIRQVYGVDAGDFFMEFAIANKDNARSPGSPLAGAHGQKWDIIKRQYAEVISQLLFPPTNVKGRSYGHKGHVLACANAKDVNSEQDDEQTVGTYQRFGVKPAGEKNLPTLFHSVLLLKPGPPWVLNTGRVGLGGVLWVGGVAGDFVFDYLMNVGGWEL